VGVISGNTKSKKNAFSKKAPQGLSYRGSHFSKLEVWLIDEALEIDLGNTLMFSSALNQIGDTYGVGFELRSRASEIDGEWRTDIRVHEIFFSLETMRESFREEFCEMVLKIAESYSCDCVLIGDSCDKSLLIFGFMD